MCSVSGAMAGAGILVSLIGTVIGMEGARREGIAKKEAADAQAQQLDINSALAKRNAADIRAQSIPEEHAVGVRTQQRIGTQRNKLSERNIDVAGSSVSRMIEDTAAYGRLDIETTQRNFEREAIAAQTQSFNFAENAKQVRKSGEYAIQASEINMGTTALGGIGNAIGMLRGIEI